MFLSAQPACSSLLLASPVLLKVPSGILSWFKSCFTCCLVIVFLGQHNAVGFFYPCDICTSSPLFALLVQPYKAIVCTLIAVQIPLDLISSSVSCAAVSTLTNCFYSAMCIPQLYEVQAEQNQSSSCSVSDASMVVFTIYLRKNE